jgi:hypothetical protein
MMPIEYKKMKTPIKIGNEVDVPTYAASMKNGEEQLLVTRDGKLFLTTGLGTYFSFKQNNIYDKGEIDQKFLDFKTDYDSKINTLSAAIVSLGNEFSKYVLKTDYDVFKLNTNNSISSIDDKIVDITDDMMQMSLDIAAVEAKAEHSNRDVLDKLSMDADGNPLFDGAKLATSVETTDAEMDTSMNTIWGGTP